MKTQRCAGCGKLLVDGDLVVVITLGKIAPTTKTAKELKLAKERGWGWMHQECFDRAMPSPAAVLKEMRRQVAASPK